MLRILMAAVAAALLLTGSFGRTDEPKPPGDKREQGIQAEVRGTLHFENGRGYFISVKPADKVEQEVTGPGGGPVQIGVILKQEGSD